MKHIKKTNFLYNDDQSRKSDAEMIGAIIDREIHPRFESLSNSQSTPILKIRSVADTSPLPEMNYLVEDLLPMPGVSALSARPKVGKSTFARYLASLVASGTPLLGRNVRRGKVLYIGLEDHPSQLDIQFKRICSEEYRENILFLVETPQSPETLLKGLREQLSLTSYSLVVIDTLVQSTRLDDWNDYGSTSRALNNFRQIANTFDCHVLLIHHNGKNTEFSGEQALLGSTGISASVDTVLLMKRRTGGADSTMIYSDRLRYGRKLEEQELYLDPESGQLTMGTSGAELQQHACEFDIIALLEESARPIGLHEIRKALGIKTETVSLALRKLVDKGQLSILGEGTRGKPKLYSLPSPTT